MGFIELDRYFVPIAKDEEPNLDIGRLWGRKIGGWLDWSEMRQLWRVVLLAEASSGKTEEFRNQADRLLKDGFPAFFVRIEELADQGIEAALEPGIAGKFQQWQAGVGESWFFLDAVDEARLNRKSFESALKHFARELGRSVERARVFISCRVSDWQGRKDLDLIARLIPAWKLPKESENCVTVNPLLDPIFTKESQTTIDPSKQSERNPNELLVVQLGPLSTEQYRCLAKAYGVDDVDIFVTAINQYGLNAFTERPGDLLDLVEYWKCHNRFTIFADMVDHSINRKLRRHVFQSPPPTSAIGRRLFFSALWCDVAATLSDSRDDMHRISNYKDIVDRKLDQVDSGVAAGNPHMRLWPRWLSLFEHGGFPLPFACILCSHYFQQED